MSSVPPASKSPCALTAAVEYVCDTFEKNKKNRNIAPWKIHNRAINPVGAQFDVPRTVFLDSHEVAEWKILFFMQ